MLGTPMGLGIVPELHPEVREVWKKFQMTNFTMPNSISFTKYALKSVHGLADVGVLHGDGDGPRAPPRCQGGPEKFQMTNFTMPNNICSMKYALKSFPALADVGDPHGVGDGPRASPRAPPRCQGGPGKTSNHQFYYA